MNWTLEPMKTFAITCVEDKDQQYWKQAVADPHLIKFEGLPDFIELVLHRPVSRSKIPLKMWQVSDKATGALVTLARSESERDTVIQNAYAKVSSVSETEYKQKQAESQDKVKGYRRLRKKGL